MKQMQIFFRIHNGDSMVLERNVCVKMEVHRTPYDVAYTIALLRIYAKDCPSNYIEFHLDDDDELYMKVHFNDVDHFETITKISLRTPTYPCEDMHIVMFDVNEYNNVKKYLEQI
jgi:hypothetical protein